MIDLVCTILLEQGCIFPSSPSSLRSTEQWFPAGRITGRIKMVKCRILSKILLWGLFSCSTPLSAATCPSVIFASGFEDGGDPPISVIPINGATNVELEDIISATFGEALASNTVDSTTFTLSRAGDPVPSTVIFNSVNKKAKLASEKTLALLTEYTATLTGCISYQSGTPLPSTSWTFTTRDGMWQAMGRVLDSGHTGPTSNPHIAVSSNGNAIAVWAEDSNGRKDIWAKFYKPDNGWGLPELVETETTESSDNPRVAMDEAGNAIVVWQQGAVAFYDSIWARRYSAIDGWGVAEPLENTEGGASEQQVAVNASGNAIAVWTQDDGFGTYSVWASAYAVNSGWTGPELMVLLTDTDAGDPQVSINDKGTAFVVWAQQDDSVAGTTHIWARQYSFGFGWLNADLVEQDTNEFAFVPQVFVDAADNVTVVWMQEDQTEDSLTHIWANRYANVTSYRDYFYTGTNFSVVSGNRFSVANNLTGVIRLNCGLAGGTGDCLSLPSADYKAAVTFCTFTASGSPALTITCDNDLSSQFVLQTDADGKVTGPYTIALESSLEGGSGARIEVNDSGGSTVARTGAAGGTGSVTYSPGAWFLGSNYAWGTPGLLETDEFSFAEDPRIAGDASGNVIAIWQQDDELTDSPITGLPIYNLWANRFTVAAGWAGPELVETGSDNDAFNPEIAVDPSGKAIAVWESNLFDGPSAISASRFVPATGWGDPETVGEIAQSDPLEAIFSSRTPIAADDFGNMHLVWDRQIGDPQDGIHTNLFGGGGDPNGRLVTDTLFADSLLRDCVVAQAAANSWDFAQEVTALNCNNKGIRSLIGLETFVNLVGLELSGNLIDDVSVISRFPGLLVLKLANNPKLTDIAALLEHSELTTIDLSGSGTGKISCPDLTELGGSVTPPVECRKTVADVTFADSVLQACVANSVKQQMVTFLDELTILNCERRTGIFDIGQIQQLDGIQILENLEIINIDRSIVSDLSPLAGMPKLKRIDLSSTYVEALDDIAALPNLEVLVLNTASRLYRDVDGVAQDPTGISILATMPALREVYLGEKDYCPAGAGAQCWTGAGRLDCATLDDLEGLFDVYVRPAGCNMPLADALAEVPDLALRNCLQLRASNEGLTDTDGFTVFEECYNGGVTDLSGLENFNRIYHLDLRLNPITDLTPLNQIRTLQILYLNNTNITSFDALTNLNVLRTIDARDIPGLTDISELLRMSRLGQFNMVTGVAYVSLGGSGNSNIACDALALLQDIVTGNGGTWDPTVVCGGPPVIPPTEGRLVDLDGDNADDLVLQFEAAEGVALTSSWTSALSSSPVFDPAWVLPAFNTAVYSRARAIALADADNDGDDDLLLQLDSATDDNIFLQVWKNNGFGQFLTSTTPLQITDGALHNVQAVAFRDVNQDGFADILTQWQQTLSGFSVAFYDLSLGNGSSFQAWDLDAPIGLFNIADKGRPRIIAFEDVNNDTYPDLVYALEPIAMESDNYQKFCFGVLTYNPASDPLFPTFKGSGSGSNCTEFKPPPRWFLESASVADITGNGRKEVVLSFNLEANIQRIGDLYHNVSMMTLEDTGPFSKWSLPIELFTENASSSPGAVTNMRTVAVADIDNDKRSDVIIEKEIVGVGKTWIALLATTGADGIPTFTPDPTRVPTPSLSDEYQAIGLLDYDDTNGLNLPDLLFRRMNMATGMYEIRVAVNNGTSFTSSTSWYSSTEMPGIIGLEEDGLTALANDTSELIAWAGDTELQTIYQLSEWLRLKNNSLTLLRRTVLDDPNPEINPNECVLAYRDADATEGDAVDAFNQYKAHGKAAMMTCNVMIGERVSIAAQGLYGGCAGTAGIAGIGGQCEIGAGKGGVTFNVAPPPLQPDEVKVGGEISGPRLRGCAEVTLTNLCLGAQGTPLADASASVELDEDVVGVGGGVGVSAGDVGAKFQAGWKDGAITIDVGLELFVGAEFVLKVNPDKTVKTFVRVGVTSYTWGRKGSSFVIYTAGPAVYGAASDFAGGTAKVARTFAGDAVNFFGDASDQGEKVFVVFIFVQGQLIDEIFAELDNMANAISNGTFGSYVSGTLIAGGEAFLSAASAIYKFFF